MSPQIVSMIKVGDTEQRVVILRLWHLCDFNGFVG
jgi:hypothetical protein